MAAGMEISSAMKLLALSTQQSRADEVPVFESQ
jgi:hypothetical protein